MGRSSRRPPQSTCESENGLAWALLTGTVSTSFVGLVSLVRIPLIIRYVGAETAGIVLAIESAVPIAMIAVAAARSAVRNAEAELSPGAVVAIPFGISRKVLLAKYSAGAIFCIAVLLVAALAKSTRVDFFEILVATVLVALLSTLAFDGGSHWGSLEAQGRFASVNSLNAVTSFLALPFTYVAARMPHTKLALVLVAGASATAPFYIARLISVRNRRINRRKPSDLGTDLNRLLIPEMVRSSLPVIVRNIDPLMMLAVAPSGGVPGYVVVQRVFLAVSALSNFAQPVWSRQLASLRAGRAARSATLSAVSRSAGLVALLSGIILISAVALIEKLGGQDLEGGLIITVVFVGASSLHIIKSAVGTVFASSSSSALAARIEATVSVAKIPITVMLMIMFGATGGAFATLIALGVTVIAMVRAIRSNPDVATDSALH